MLRYSFGGDANHTSITAMGYSASWNSTDQIPLRAVESGLIGRFGAIDPSDGGHTERYSLSFNTMHRFDDGEFKLSAYAIRSKLDLFSDFTYFLEHPIDLDPGAVAGDQFEQAESRTDLRPVDEPRVEHEARRLRHRQHDRPAAAPRPARSRRPLQHASHAYAKSTTQESTVRETSAALYAENATQWLPWFRSVAGLRADRFWFDVKSSIAENSGKRSAGIGSPKLSLVFGPWAKTEYFVNYGQSFHSNDARGTTETVTPKERDPAEPVTPLVRSKGGELGLRTEIVPGLQSSLALWQLKLGSELVFSGDAGDTEASRSSRRSGIELNNHYLATRWLLLDADLAFSRARYTQFDPVGQHIPGSVDQVVSAGATVIGLGPWFGQFQLRYFGPRPLIEDDSVRSRSTTLAYLRLGYEITPSVKLALDVFNLFDRQASDIDYYYASRLKGEPAAGVDDIHFHPVEPRRLRVTLSANF